MKAIPAFLIFFIVASPALLTSCAMHKDKTVPLSSGDTPQYKVIDGDSWWRIAERELGSGLRYDELQEVNPGLTELHVGALINIPGKDLSTAVKQPVTPQAPTAPALSGIRPEKPMVLPTTNALPVHRPTRSNSKQHSPNDYTDTGDLNWPEIESELKQHSSKTKKALALFPLGYFNIEFASTFRREFAKGGNDAERVSIVFMHFHANMARLAQYADWPEFQEFCEREQLDTEAYILKKIDLEELMLRFKKNGKFKISLLDKANLSQADCAMIFDRNPSLESFCENLGSAILLSAKNLAKQPRPSSSTSTSNTNRANRIVGQSDWYSVAGKQIAVVRPSDYYPISKGGSLEQLHHSATKELLRNSKAVGYIDLFLADSTPKSSKNNFEISFDHGPVLQLNYNKMVGTSLSLQEWRVAMTQLQSGQGQEVLSEIATNELRNYRNYFNSFFGINGDFIGEPRMIWSGTSVPDTFSVCMVLEFEGTPVAMMNTMFLRNGCVLMGLTYVRIEEQDAVSAIEKAKSRNWNWIRRIVESE